VDIASLVAYRVLFGALMAWGLFRFWWNGWLERSFIEPTFFFRYWGFEWVTVPGPVGVYAVFALGTIAALMVAFGLFYRASALVVFLSFTYIELMDQSNYLNHYYLLSILSFLNLFLPLNRKWSLDVALGFVKEADYVPAWCLNLLRFQVACVYFFAGIGKIGTDWLLHAQPLNLWMMSQVDVPVIGPWLAQSAVQYMMAWSGFLFDTFIWIFLLVPTTRAAAYGVVLVFHFFTGVFFPIGLFPYIMISCATVFFSPSWPRRFLRSAPAARLSNLSVKPLTVAAIGIFALVQLALPFRHFLYPSDLLWSEEGMRFSWRVMVREKNGQVTFKVTDRDSGKRWEISPGQYLAQHQELEMSGQPDMIWQLAKHIEKDFLNRGRKVAVRAEAWVSLNGRPATLLLDPEVDLTQVEDSLAPKNWILPGPRSAPTSLSQAKLGNP